MALFTNFFEKIPVRILDALFRVFRFSKESFKGPDIFIHNRFKTLTPSWHWDVLNVIVIGTLRSDDGHGNGNDTKAIGLISKTTNFAPILHVHRAFFVHFFAVTARLRRENASFQDVQRKYTIASDVEISSLFLNLHMVLRNSYLGGFAYIWIYLTKLVTWINRDEDWKNAISLFQRRFLCRRRPRILRSLL